jgi:hypothetical protein
MAIFLEEYSRSPLMPQDEAGKDIYIATELDKISSTLYNILKVLREIDERLIALEP